MTVHNTSGPGGPVGPRGPGGPGVPGLGPTFPPCPFVCNVKSCKVNLKTENKAYLIK